LLPFHSSVRDGHCTTGLCVLELAIDQSSVLVQFDVPGDPAPESLSTLLA
jgi:hypothetical protein